MAGKVRWWHGILVRSLLAVLAATLLMGAFSTHTVNRVIGERSHGQALTRLGELLDTVESTARVACFVGDEQLAQEVAEGLLRNTEVRRVEILAGERTLAVAERTPRENGAEDEAAAAAEASAVKRPLYSPFNAGEAIGTIRIEADKAAIDARAHSDTLYIGALLAGQIVLVVAAAILVIFLFLLRPIKATSDRLHRLDAAAGERLAIPQGHEKTEVGRLVEDVNQLTGRLVAALEQERSLRQEQEVDQRKYQNLFDNAGSGIFVADRMGGIDSCNRAWSELARLPQQTGIARRLVTDVHWQDPGQLLAMIGACLEAEGRDARATLADDFIIHGQRGDERWLHVAVVALGDGRVQGTISDVTQRKRAELSARHLALTDTLTGVANRDGLQRQLADLQPDSKPFALVMVDLDSFKQINDALGFPVGDALLRGVATRLRETLADGEQLARIGSDEFALILAGAGERQGIAARVERLAERLGHPYDIQTTDTRRTLTINASLGVALFPQDGSDIHQLLRAAELALNSARAADGCTWKFSDPALQAAAEHRHHLEDDLRAAVAARELQLAFQPIIDLCSGGAVGAEALLRWPHPQRGCVSPDVFVPLAEELGLIGKLGLAVLDGACRHLALWRNQGLDLYVSVNVSARQIPDELPPVVVLDILRSHGLPPAALVLEITEGVLMSHVAVAQSWIESLRTVGVRIFLDDFGTGYSSLSYLKRFALDSVKIDKSFIRELHADMNDLALVHAIVTMADSLGLHVVAEGVENERQLAALKEMGCSYGQGYHFSGPVAAADFATVVGRLDGAGNDNT